MIRRDGKAHRSQQAEGSQGRGLLAHELEIVEPAQQQDPEEGEGGPQERRDENSGSPEVDTRSIDHGDANRSLSEIEARMCMGRNRLIGKPSSDNRRCSARHHRRGNETRILPALQAPNDSSASRPWFRELSHQPSKSGLRSPARSERAFERRFGMAPSLFREMHAAD